MFLKNCFMLCIYIFLYVYVCDVYVYVCKYIVYVFTGKCVRRCICVCLSVEVRGWCLVFNLIVNYLIYGGRVNIFNKDFIDLIILVK